MLGYCSTTTFSALYSQEMNWIEMDFGGKSVIVGRWQTMVELGFFAGFGITFLSLFILSYAFIT